MRHSRPRHLLATALAAVALSACAGEGRPMSTEGQRSTSPTTGPGESRAPAPAPDPSRAPDEEPVYGTPAPAQLTIPDLDLRSFAVVPYQGRTDDARGTDIQNNGRLASPHGPDGGTGPGGVGNYEVTGHRLSSTMPFRYLPQLTRGDTVYVESRGVRHVYRIVTTRETSFRSVRSLREQRAAVPAASIRPERC